ncbi:MAG TPA: DUF2497 domain-containing protein [Stellaceae bacterium]
MSEAKGQNEPSMEEILASIRRIIAEDGEPAGQSAPAAPPSPVAVAEPERNGSAAAAAVAPVSSSAHDRMDEILELTEVVDEHGDVVGAEPELEPEPEPESPPPPPRAAAAVPPPPVDERPAPPPPPLPFREPAVAAADPGERLVSATTAAASVAALAELHGMAARSGGRAEDIALGAAHRTLEELIRDMLRPMLQSWLDANLPDMVERLVREEIGRMVRDARQR